MKKIEHAPARKGTKIKENVASAIVESMREFVESLESGVPTYTVKRVAMPEPGRTPKPDDVRGIRESLGASQAVMASLIGAAAGTLRAWEQGTKSPSSIAARFLEEIRSNPEYWKGRLKEMVRKAG